jgi:hypothetical protein
MKSTLKSQITTGLLALCSAVTLTVRAGPETYEGHRVRGVETQNGGAVETRNGAGAVNTRNGGGVQTRNGAAAVNTKNGGAVQTRRGGKAVSGPNGTAIETRNGNVYTDPSNNANRHNGKRDN